MPLLRGFDRLSRAWYDTVRGASRPRWIAGKLDSLRPALVARTSHAI